MNETFIKVAHNLTDKKLIRTANSLSKKYKPTVERELERTNDLLTKLYFKGHTAEALEIIKLLEIIEFNGDQRIWEWVQMSLFLKCWILSCKSTQNNDEIQNIVNKINETYNFGTNDLVKKVNKNVRARKLRGEHLRFDDIKTAQESGDIQQELQYRIFYFYDLLYIYFLGGSNEFTTDKALKALKENETIIRGLI